MELCYFDYAAATPLDERVFLAMKPYLMQDFYNPSSPYVQAVKVRRDYEQAKNSIAQIIGASGDELVMTAGATESINIAISSFGGHKICPATEHDSVKHTIMTGEHTILPVCNDGRIDIDALKSAIKSNTELISIALANHEIGTIQPIKQVAQIVQAEREKRRECNNQTPLVLHCDASQGCGLVDIHVARLGIDMVTLNAAKIYGPKQVGLLWVKPGVTLKPQIYGGGQEMGVRSGTENVAGVIGYAEAMRIADKKRKGESERLCKLRDYMQNRLVDAFPDVVVSGNIKHRLANFLHVSFAGLDAERLIFILENRNVLVATGSACAARKNAISQTLLAIGMGEDLANGSLRITLGRHTTKAQCDLAVDEIIKAVQLEQRRIGRLK